MKTNKNKNVLLIGGRNKAISLAVSLIEQGYKVVAINTSYEDCVNLAEIKNLTVIHGDGTKPHILDEAGASNADIAIALTGKDADNLIACQLCKKQFNIPKTVCLVTDPKKTEFFHKMGVDRVVCAVAAVTGIIRQQALIDEMANIVSVGMGRIQIVEVQINLSSPVADKKLWEITLPKESIVGCILRRDETLIPRGDTRILTGDTLVVLVANGLEFETISALTGGSAT